MNDQLFNDRAHANPHDDSPEFLEAIAQKPERQALLVELKALDSFLKSGLSAVSAPDHLKQRLLDIPEGTLHPDTNVSAANESFWRRNVQYAAGLVVALGLLALMLPGKVNPMEELVFNHIYSELSFLDDDTPIPMAVVNNIMNSQVGIGFRQSPEMNSLEIDVTEDCWVDIQNGLKGIHMVVKGNAGQVTVMVIPNEPIDSELSISDERFEGMITPTEHGNLVVVGEKDEAIQMYSNLLAANINW
ncbi:MAG: DUF3379 family protein [Gammaproteobacteria bacterium]|jgi:hypothetical protein|nr:DUF3379 family protein [Gammaproteobacteria bacterium]MBT6041875.1 DUF3379 family protein [Gammaproteobacteria bacterium]